MEAKIAEEHMPKETISVPQRFPGRDGHLRLIAVKICAKPF